MKRTHTFVFFDNLTLHHTVLVREKAKSNNQELVFNASYSSHLNPIERLWALAKRQFRKDCVNGISFDNQEEIIGLVGKTILEASRATLERHVRACLI